MQQIERTEFSCPCCKTRYVVETADVSSSEAELCPFCGWDLREEQDDPDDDDCDE
jgi:uncharacterized Zn-finger protein